MSEGTRRIAFSIVAGVAALVIWIPAYPPLIDLPQHAGQVRFFHDWLFTDFAWGKEIGLNLFTPYLAGCALGALFTTVMPAIAATKLVWSLATLGTVYTSVRLRRLVGGDPRWDWLVLPGLFGMTFAWGFFSFFASIPIGLYALERWIIYLRGPNRRNALAVAGMFVLVFFGHVLTMAWALLVASIMLLGDWRDGVRRLAVRGLPLLVPVPIVIAWWEHHNLWAGPSGPTDWGLDTHRFVKFGSNWLGIASPISVAVAVLLLALPFVAGARFARDPVRLAALVVTFAIVMMGPSTLSGNVFNYHRFFTLLSPSFVLALAAPAATSQLVRLRALVPALATAWTLLIAARMLAFRAESDDFARIVDRMAPGRHVVGMALQPASDAVGRSRAYMHFSVWYQAETGGFTESSFSNYPVVVMRAKDPNGSQIKRGFEWTPHSFDVSAVDYILARSGSEDSPLRDSTSVRLVAHENTWWLYVPAR